MLRTIQPLVACANPLSIGNLARSWYAPIVPAIAVVLTLISGPVQAQEPLPLPSDINAPAPLQFQQHTFFPSHSIDDVLKGHVFPEQEFLPADIWEDEPIRDAEVQFTQYPLEDSGANDALTPPEPAPLHHRQPQLDGPPPRWLVVQDHQLTATVIPGSGNDMGITTLDFRTTLFTEHFPLLRLKPRFSAHYLSGPKKTDMPGSLYDLALDISLFLPINQRWSFLGGISPSMFSDFENTSSDAVRITGRALFFWKYSEALRLAGGMIYLDREDVSVLPAVGLTYTPSEDLKFDIMFPKPKVAYRYMHDRSMERWIYLAGEFGGGSWAIDRASGLEDVATYSDYKLIVGIDHKESEMFSWFAEAAYVFNRDLEYVSGVGDTDLPGTGMIRVGLSF